VRVRQPMKTIAKFIAKRIFIVFAYPEVSVGGNESDQCDSTKN
jgi:hypothetical protein